MTETPNPNIVDADTLTGEMRPIRRVVIALGSNLGERFATLCNEDVYDFVFRSACFPNFIPTPCVETAAIGEHPQCAVWDDGGSYARCGDGVTGPCWRLEYQANRHWYGASVADPAIAAYAAAQRGPKSANASDAAWRQWVFPGRYALANDGDI